MRRAFTLIELLVVVAIIAIIAGLLMASLASGTSDGHREGYVQKFSKKNGWVSSSHEGELAQAGFGGSQTDKPGQQGGNVWSFYATDPKIIETLDALDSRTFVRLHYHESRWAWGHWTNYEVTKVEVKKGD